MQKEEIYKKFEELDKVAALGGGVVRIDKQHEAGRMTARERIDMLLDKGTFVELDKFVTHRCTNFGMEKNKIPGDGVVSGYGKIEGRQVFVYAYDFTAYGGTLSSTNAAKIVKVQTLALKNGAPVIALNDSGGARIQEGVGSLAGYASIFYQNTMASGVVPQISAILGPCAGGACYSPALTDFIFMVKEKSHMFITGPDVVKAVTHETVEKEELGGAYVHSSKSGVTHFVCDTEEETLMSIRELLSFLPSNNMEDAPSLPCSDDIRRETETLQTVIPDDPNVPYDMKDVIEPVVDNHYFFEVMSHFAKNVVVGFARLGGQSVGIVANQPAFLAGVLDIDASDKAARFIRFCDCFNIPLVTFEDVPGFLPGCQQEHDGIIRHGAKIVYAYAEATVPKITLITRKAYGGAYIVMSSKPIGADINLAYPMAEIAVMGAEGAVNILYRKAEGEEKAQAIQEKFMEKCRGILAIAKKKKNVLDYKEIMNYFQDTDFEADKMEKVFEFLEACNVDVKMNDDEVEEDDILLDDEDDIEVFKYAEKLPVALNGYTNLYEYADFCYTNMLVDINNDKLYKLYKTEDKVLEFY